MLMKMNLDGEILKFLRVADLREITRKDFEVKGERSVKFRDALGKKAEEIAYEGIHPYYLERGLDLAVNGVWMVFNETLRNAGFWSDYVGPLPINVALLLAPTSFVLGYCDHGSYFTREDVKGCWEARVRHSEKREFLRECGLGANTGTDLIYSMTDFIHVDSKAGTLYTGFSTSGTCFG